MSRIVSILGRVLPALSSAGRLALALTALVAGSAQPGLARPTTPSSTA